MTESPALHDAALALAATLAQSRLQLVLAESCTGGLAAAALAGVPGISNWLCGSAVVYQNETKSAWLGVPDEIIDGPGPVGAEMSGELARRVLHRTPQADVAAAVTGHLGPDAPPELDGRVFVAFARRGEHRIEAETLQIGDGGESATSADAIAAQRQRRQRVAAEFALTFVNERLAGGGSS